MVEDDLYSIGKIGEMCGVTTKTLRHYDKMGLLQPDKVSKENGYRYYSKKKILSVPMIKYYKQSGFKLEEMKAFLNGTTYDFFDEKFREKILELDELEREINLKKVSVKDWHDLILEAKMVLENNISDVSVKYINNSSNYAFLEQKFDYNYTDTVVNLEFNKYIENINNAVTGPVIICFDSYKDKINGKCNNVKILQKTILKLAEEKKTDFGGWMAISCYHIGSHSNINDTYNKMETWSCDHGYTCLNESYERYVTDYWSTNEEDKFVTEVIIRVKRGK